MKTLLFVVALLTVAGINARAQGKTTVDPNVGLASSTEVSVDSDKERLAQKITYEARRKPVCEILQDISKLSEVTLKSGYNEKDWQVRDRKMNIFAKDVPLGELMSSIARAMKFKWRWEEKDKVRIYRLIMDRKTLLDAESRRARDEERLEARAVETRKQTLSAYAKLSSLSGADLEKLKTDDPYQYVLATSGYAKGLDTFFSAVPGARDALASGQECTFPVATLPDAAQQGCRQMIQAVLDIVTRLMGKSLPEIPKDYVANLSTDKMKFVSNPNAHFSWDRELGGIVAANMQVWFDGKSHSDLPLLSPGSRLAKVLGDTLVRDDLAGRPMDEIQKEINEAAVGAAIADLEKDEFMEKATEHPDDPDLQAKVKIKPESGKLQDVQAALAKASGQAVVSDNFGAATMEAMIPSIAKESTLRDTLDSIAKLYLYNWDKRGNVIEFRDRSWYRKRAAQIPDAWLEAWRATLKNSGTLGLDELVQIAMLDSDQITMNILADPILGASGIKEAMMAGQDTLRFYASLGDAQRKTLFSETGLDSASLTPSQLSQIRAIISRRDAVVLIDPDVQLVLTGTRTQDKKDRTNYSFAAAVGEGVKPLEWSFTAPRYAPPKEQVKNEAAPKGAAPAPRQ